MAARLAVKREDETDGINEYSSVDLSQSDLLMMSGGERRERRRRERANKMEPRHVTLSGSNHEAVRIIIKIFQVRA